MLIQLKQIKFCAFQLDFFPQVQQNWQCVPNERCKKCIPNERFILLLQLE